MTVSSTQNRAAFNCDGVTTQFDFNFPYQRDADIRVLVRSPTGVETTLANLSDYSIANAGTGGRITVANPRSSGWRIVILRAPEPVQETDLLENGTYSAETLERAYDYRAMVEQRLGDLLARALILAETDTQGAGTYLAGGNRITALGDAVAGTDAVTLAQVQGLVAAGGGGGGGTPVGWPPLPIPPAVQDAINQGVLTASEFQEVFTPINSQIGNLSAQILSLNSSVAGINTSIGTINTSITSMQADIDLLEQISGDANNIITLIQTEEQERIDGDVAMAAVIAKIGAADADTVSFILNTATVKISPTETIGTRFSGIATQLGTATASIASEQTARIAGDNTLAQTIAKIGALSGNGAAFIIDVNTAYVDATTSLGQRFSGLTSAVNGANAAITSEASTRASADTSLASQISTLQSSVSGFNVSIQANATAINGVQAKYTVKIDNNGRVTGFGLISEPNNGSIVSSFVINADAFKVFNGSTDVAPFLVTGGVVRMQNVEINAALIVDASITAAKIGDAQVTNAKIGNLEVDSAKIADLTVGTTKITQNATSAVAFAETASWTASTSTWTALLNVTIDHRKNGQSYTQPQVLVRLTTYLASGAVTPPPGDQRFFRFRLRLYDLQAGAYISPDPNKYWPSSTAYFHSAAGADIYGYSSGRQAAFDMVVSGSDVDNRQVRYEMQVYAESLASASVDGFTTTLTVMENRR
jgi:hypothetical protein